MSLNNLTRKFKKLRRMSPAEVRQRMAGKMSQRRERTLYRHAQSDGSSESASYAVTETDGLLAACSRLVPGCGRYQFSQLQTVCPSLARKMKHQARQNADAILRGRWEMLGCEIDLTGHVDWHADFRTGFTWERNFYADLQLYGLQGNTDIKYPWELSRHQFLCELSRNYLLNGCEASADRARRLIIDWIEQNPLYEGVNWTSSLEVAMRSLSWIWTLAGLQDWDGWEPGDVARISKSLQQHAIYLSSNFSYYSSPYNHLIGESTGLLWIAYLFEENETVLGWRSLARKVLLEAAPRQFYEDHFCVEQAVGYHYFTLGFLLMAFQVSKEAGHPLTELTDSIQLAFRTGLAFRRPDGTWPAIGDLDSARAIPVHASNYWSFDTLNQLAAIIFEDAGLKQYDAEDPGEELYWLFGTDGVADWLHLHHRKVPSSYLLKDAGYAIASRGDDWLLFDAGSIAHGLHSDSTPSTAHGHADSLQVLYQHGKCNVLHDPGMPYYGGDPEWVSYFRSPAAHNTVKIEGADFVKDAGKLAWSSEFQRPEISAEFTDSVWLCSGVASWTNVTHHRHVCCLPGIGLWIADLILTNQVRDATWYWQLPDLNFRLHESNRISWTQSEMSDAHLDRNRDLAIATSSLTCVANEPIGNYQLKLASESIAAGWRCEGYGKKQAAVRISLQHRVDNQFLMLTSMGNSNRPKMSVELGRLIASEAKQKQVTQSDLASVGTLEGCRWLMVSNAEEEKEFTNNNKHSLMANLERKWG